MTLQILMGKLTNKVRSIGSWIILILAAQAIISNYQWIVAVKNDEPISPYTLAFGKTLIWILIILTLVFVVRFIFQKFRQTVIDEGEEEEMVKSEELPGFLDVSGVSVPQGPLSDAEKMSIMRGVMDTQLHNGHEFWRVAEKNGRRTEGGNKDKKWNTYCLSQKQKYKPLSSSPTD